MRRPTIPMRRELTMLLVTAAAVIAAILIPRSGAAQAVRVDLPHPGTAACNKAIERLRTEFQAVPDSQLVALSIASRCGSRGYAAIAHAWRSRRKESYSRALDEFFYLVVDDSSVFRTAIDLAQAVGASDAVRVLSMRVLMGYLLTRWSPVPLSDLDGTPIGHACDLPQYTDALENMITLAVKDVQEIADVMTALENNASQPPKVRSGANCVCNVWRRENGYPIQVLGAIDPDAVTIEYVCENIFWIQNTSPTALVVKLFGISTPGEVFVAARPIGKKASVQFLATEPGVVRLVLDGQVIEERSFPGPPC